MSICTETYVKAEKLAKNQKTESEKVKPLTRPDAIIHPRINFDVTPTAKKITETYRQKLIFDDKSGLAEIEKTGIKLNQIYQQTHPDRERAPDDFKHPDVCIDAEILEVYIPSAVNVTYESKSQTRSQDRGMGM